MAKAIPAHADLINYNYAVAGHDGTLSDVDGELFIKPCTAAEVAFYETSIASHPSFAEYMPVFLGTLSLDQQTSDVNILAAGEALLAQHNHAVSLDPTHHEHHAHLTVAQDGTICEDENAHSCAHPSHTKENGTAPILEQAPPKVPAAEGDAQQSGSKIVGKRIQTNQALVLENAAHGFVKPNILDAKLGVRLYADDASAEKKARFDKVSLETTHRDLGFRIAGMRVWQGPSAKENSLEHIDEEGYKIYDKNYGRVDVNTGNINDAFRNFLFCESAGVTKELGELVAQALATDVERIMKVLEGQESRMFSASLLFIFEGDGEALRKAMEEASVPKESKDTLNGANGTEDGDESEDEDEGPKIYSVKVIDFAHAEWTAGQGPDENSLKGVRSVARILREIGGGSSS